MTDPHFLGVSIPAEKSGEGAIAPWDAPGIRVGVRGCIKSVYIWGRNLITTLFLNKGTASEKTLLYVLLS